jgi:hypothetical protein
LKDKVRDWQTELMVFKRGNEFLLNKDIKVQEGDATMLP